MDSAFSLAQLQDYFHAVWCYEFKDEAKAVERKYKQNVRTAEAAKLRKERAAEKEVRRLARLEQYRLERAALDGEDEDEGTSEEQDGSVSHAEITEGGLEGAERTHVVRNGENDTTLTSENCELKGQEQTLADDPLASLCQSSDSDRVLHPYSLIIAAPESGSCDTVQRDDVSLGIAPLDQFDADNDDSDDSDQPMHIDEDSQPNSLIAATF
jgi:hypothetical protein